MTGCNNNKDWPSPFFLQPHMKLVAIFLAKSMYFPPRQAVREREKINYEVFAQEWNCTANGKDQVYISPEVLVAYMKSWAKSNNIWVTKEMVSDKLVEVRQSGEVFSAETLPFLDFLTGNAHMTHPSEGILEMDLIQKLPKGSSISIASIVSHSSLSNDLQVLKVLPIATTQPSSSLLSLLLLSFRVPPEPLYNHFPSDNLSPPADLPCCSPDSPVMPIVPDDSAPSPCIEHESQYAALPAPLVSHTVEPATEDRVTDNRCHDTDMERDRKRCRTIPLEDQRQQKIQSCRRCRKESCPGGINILQCPVRCAVLCKKCKRLEGCQGIDGGQKCTAWNVGS